MIVIALESLTQHAIESASTVASFQALDASHIPAIYSGMDLFLVRRRTLAEGLNRTDFVGNRV